MIVLLLAGVVGVISGMLLLLSVDIAPRALR